MSKKQIFSTLTTDQNYTLYKKDQRPGEPALLEVVNGKPANILIKGGHGVANEYFQTPQGVCTEVSEDVYAVLATIPMFIRHKAMGFIKVFEKKGAPATAEQAAEDMAAKDGGAPLVSSDFEQGKAPTVTGAPA